MSDIAAAGCDSMAVGEALTRARTIAEFCAAHAECIDEEGNFPVEEFHRIVAAGLLPVSLGCQHGGLGFGIEPGRTLPQLLLLEEMGRGNLAVGRVYEGHLNALQLIEIFGTSAQIAWTAADVCERQKLYGVWNTESTDGVKLIACAGGRYRLEGAKTFASGAGHVDRPIIGAALEDGRYQMVIVRMDEVATRHDPSWWQPLGMRATASFKVDFTGVELGEDALLGVPGDYYRQPWLTAGVIRFAAVQLGGAGALLDCARDRMRSKGWGSDPYQRQRMARAAIAIESGRLWLRGAAEQMDRFLASEGQGDAQSLITYANMTRTAIEAGCLEVMQAATKSVGARCLIGPHPIERIVRDLTLYLCQPAPDATVAQIGAHVIERTASIHTLWLDE